MDERGGGGSFVAVRRISQGLDRSSACHSASAEVVAGSSAWIGRGLSCICAQRRDSDGCPSFDLTSAQEECLLALQNRIDVAYDSSLPEHQAVMKATRHQLEKELLQEDITCIEELPSYTLLTQ